MKLNRNIYSSFQSSYQLSCLVRNKQACHILDTDGIRTHILYSFCHIYPVVQGISIAQGIGQGNLCMSFFLVGCFYGCLQVS